MHGPAPVQKRSETGPPLYLQFLYCYVYLNFCFTFSFCCIILSVYKNRLYCSSQENRIGYIVSYKCVLFISGALKRMLNLNVTFSKTSLAEPQWKVRKNDEQLFV